MPGSPVTAGSSHGCSGCGRNQPPSRSWRKLPAAGGFCFRFFFSFFFPGSSCRFAAAAAVTCGASAASASAAVRAASSSSASRPSGTRSASAATARPQPSRRADPATVGGQQFLAQPAAASAIASGPRYPHAAPATSTDTAGPAYGGSPASSAGPSAAPPAPAAAPPAPALPRRPGGGGQPRSAMMHPRARPFTVTFQTVSTRIIPRAAPSSQAHPPHRARVSRTPPKVRYGK